MKKDDLKEAVENLRSQLNCDNVITLLERMLNGHSAQGEFIAGANSIVEMIVASVGNFNRLPVPIAKIASQTGIDQIYSPSKFSPWISFWTQARLEIENAAATAVDPKVRAFFSGGNFVRFVDLHRRIICVDDLLKSTLRAQRGEDELILEGGSEANDPNINEVIEVLAVLRDLADAYCRIDEPNVNQTIRVTYLDMGSKFDLGIKVDVKAETGPNLTKVIMQIFSIIMNPTAWRRSREIESQLEEVEAFALINQRRQDGLLSEEEAALLKARLLRDTTRLAELRAYPIQFASQNVTRTAPDELDELVNRPEVRNELGLPSPNLALPPSPPESDSNPRRE